VAAEVLLLSVLAIVLVRVVMVDDFAQVERRVDLLSKHQLVASLDIGALGSHRATLSICLLEPNGRMVSPASARNQLLQVGRGLGTIPSLRSYHSIDLLRLSTTWPVLLILSVNLGLLRIQPYRCW